MKTVFEADVECLYCGTGMAKYKECPSALDMWWMGAIASDNVIFVCAPCDMTLTEDDYYGFYEL